MITLTIMVPGQVPVHVNIIDSRTSIAQSVSDCRLENYVPSLSIPPKLREGLAALGSLSDDCYTTFFKALKEAAPADTAKDLAARIENEFPESSKSKIESIIRAVNVSQSVQKSAHVEPEEFASDAWEGLKEDAPKLVAGIDREKFKARLSALVSETDIQLTTSKIKELRGETERHMCGARIITDIRPAFFHDATKPPKAMTIMHTLQIQYHDDSAKHHEFYVSVNENDLGILKEAIDRALSKEKTLKEMFGGAQFQIFE